MMNYLPFSYYDKSVQLLRFMRFLGWYSSIGTLHLYYITLKCNGAVIIWSYKV